MHIFEKVMYQKRNVSLSFEYYMN